MIYVSPYSEFTNATDRYNSHILVSTVNESHLFRFGEGADASTLKRMETTHVGGLITDQPTLAFSNFYRRQGKEYVNSSLVVQIVPTGAYLFEWDSIMNTYVERMKWPAAPPAIPAPVVVVAACVNASQVALALSGGIIVWLSIESNKANLELKS